MAGNPLGNPQQPIDVDDDDEEQDDHAWVFSMERKVKAIEFIKSTCQKTAAAANICSVLDGFRTAENFIKWMDKNTDWERAQKAILILILTGTITKKQLKDLKIRNPLESVQADHPLSTCGGIYLHATSLPDPKTPGEPDDGKLKWYIGSARGSMMRIDNKAEQGLCKRVNRYIKFDRLHKANTNTDEYKTLRKELAEHATHWPKRGEKAEVDVWITCFSMDTVTLFDAMCGGKSGVGKELIPVWRSSSSHPDIKPFKELSDGVTFLLETIVSLLCGVACKEGKGGQRVAAIDKAVRNDKHPILWIDRALEADVDFETTNSRLQLYEVDGADPSTRPTFEKKWEMFDALPRSIVNIRKFLAARKAWYPLPRDDQGLLDLGLPLNLDANTGGQRERAKAVLSQLAFDGTGQGQLFPIKRYRNTLGCWVWSTSNSNTWKQFVGVTLSRNHPDCEDDADSYQPRAQDQTAATNNAELFVPNQRDTQNKRTTQYQVVISTLDAHGLLPVTLTGVAVNYYDDAGVLLYTAKREVGEEVVGTQYNMLARIAAILRIALAFERAESFRLGLGRLFQSPIVPPLPGLDQADRGGAEPSVVDADFARGFQAVEDSMDELEAYQPAYAFAWDFPTCGIVEPVDPDKVNYDDHTRHPGRLGKTGQFGYLLVPALPIINLEQNVYAEGMGNTVSVVLHEGVSRLVVPVAPAFVDDVYEVERLECGVGMKRFRHEDTFFTVYIDGKLPGANNSLAILEPHLRVGDGQIGDQAIDVKFTLDGVVIKMRTIDHPYPDSRVYFQQASYPEVLLYVACSSIKTRSRQQTTRHFGRITAQEVSPTVRTLGAAEQVLEYLGQLLERVTAGGRTHVSAEQGAVLLGTIVSIAMYAESKLQWDLVAMVLILDECDPNPDKAQRVLPRRLLLQAIAVAASSSWVDIGHAIVEKMFKLFRFGPAPTKEDRELLEVLAMLPWDDALLVAKSWYRDGFELGTIDLGTVMCSVPRPYFWDAVRVQKRDKVLVLEMDCSGVQLLDLGRKGSLKWDIHNSKISYVQVLNSTVEPAADETFSCALVFFDYRLSGMEQLQKVNILNGVSSSEVFDKTVRWIADTRWANIDVPIQSGDWLMSQLMSESSQNTGTTARSASQPSNDSQGSQPMAVDEREKSPELEERFDRMGAADMDDEEEVEPSQLPRRPRRPVITSSPTKGSDEPDDIDSFGSDWRG